MARLLTPTEIRVRDDLGTDIGELRASSREGRMIARLALDVEYEKHGWAECSKHRDALAAEVVRLRATENAAFASGVKSCIAHIELEFPDAKRIAKELEDKFLPSTGETP